MIALTALMIATSAAYTQDGPAVFRKVSPSVCSIRTAKGTGTGFIDDAGRLVTAAHVLETTTELVIRDAAGKVLTARRIVALDRGRDVAVLEIQETRPKLELDTTGTASIGERVYVIGSPLGLDQTLTEGLISAKRNIDGRGYLQISASISPGSSGSPVVNAQGRVLGIVVSRVHAGEGLGFALSAHEVSSVRGVDLELLADRPVMSMSTKVAQEDLQRQLVTRRFLVADPTYATGLYKEEFALAGLSASLAENVYKVLGEDFKTFGFVVFTTGQALRDRFGLTESSSSGARNYAMRQVLSPSCSLNSSASGLPGSIVFTFTVSVGGVTRTDGYEQEDLLKVEVSVLARDASRKRDCEAAVSSAIDRFVEEAHALFPSPGTALSRDSFASGHFTLYGR